MATLVKRTKVSYHATGSGGQFRGEGLCRCASASAQASGSGSSFWVFGQQALGSLAFVRMRFGMGAGTAGTGFGGQRHGIAWRLLRRLDAYAHLLPCCQCLVGHVPPPSLQHVARQVFVDGQRIEAGIHIRRVDGDGLPLFRWR
jgi:hypothetical protein